MVHLRCGDKSVHLHSLQLTTTACWLFMVHTQLSRICVASAAGDYSHPAAAAALLLQGRGKCNRQSMLLQDAVAASQLLRCVACWVSMDYKQEWHQLCYATRTPPHVHKGHRRRPP